MGRIRSLLFGGPTRLGFWTLPVFLIVGLAGAVLAGSITVVYYSQQVQALKDETASVREEAAATVEQIQQAGEAALAEIDGQVAAVEESLSRQLPVEDVTSLGVVIIRATTNVPPPPPPPVPDPTPDPTPAAGDDGSTAPPAGSENPDGAPVPTDVRAQSDPASEPPAETEPPASSPSPSPSPTPSPTPAPVVLPREPKIGIGFAVAVSDGSTFFATSYGLVADPNARAGVVESVEVVTTEGTFQATVHDWDAARDLAIVRSRFTGPLIGDWRQRSERVAVGERLWLVGITPTRVQAQLELTTGYVTDTEMLADIGRKDQFRGAPIVDRTGRITAIYTPDYRPFGDEAGEGQAILPVHVLCERLIQGCENLEAPPPDEDG